MARTTERRPLESSTQGICSTSSNSRNSAAAATSAGAVTPRHPSRSLVVGVHFAVQLGIAPFVDLEGAAKGASAFSAASSSARGRRSPVPKRASCTSAPPRRPCLGPSPTPGGYVRRSLWDRSTALGYLALVFVPIHPSAWRDCLKAIGTLDLSSHMVREALLGLLLSIHRPRISLCRELSDSF